MSVRDQSRPPGCGSAFFSRRRRSLTVDREGPRPQLGRGANNGRIAIGPLVAAAGERRTASLSRRTISRYPSCLISCTQSGPAGGLRARVGMQGSTKSSSARRDPCGGRGAILVPMRLQSTFALSRVVVPMMSREATARGRVRCALGRYWQRAAKGQVHLRRKLAQATSLGVPDYESGGQEFESLRARQ
jgi:hypothetical protein